MNRIGPLVVTIAVLVAGVTLPESALAAQRPFFIAAPIAWWHSIEDWLSDQLLAQGVFVQSASAVVAMTPAVVRIDLQPFASSTPPQTVVQNYITQPVIERTIQWATVENGTAFDTRLEQTANTLRSEFYAAMNRVESPPASGGAWNAIALTNRIDQLSGTSLSNITVNGVSGLTDADIPDGVTASNYLPLAGGMLSGDLTLSGNLTVSGAQTLSGAITIPYLTATSTSADSSFVRLSATNATTTNATSTTFFATTASSTNLYSTNATIGVLSLGTLSLTNALTVSNGGTGAQSFGQGWIYSSGGTTTLAASTSPTVNYITATSTTATTTLAGMLAVGSNALNVLSNGNVGIGTASPVKKLDVIGDVRASTGFYALNNTGYFMRSVADDFDITLITLNASNQTVINNGNGQSVLINNSNAGNVSLAAGGGGVGVGLTSPSYKLDVAGFINTDQYSGYKQAGNTILYASSTNSSMIGGIGAGTNYQTVAGAVQSTAFGHAALASASLDASADGNTAIGFQALTSNTSGSYNTGLGWQALQGNTTGYDNVALGKYALFANTTGASNVANGAFALFTATSTSNQTAIGYGALQNTATGISNLAIGHNVLFANTYGNYNLGVGEYALTANSTGGQNVAVGWGTLRSNTIGVYNQAFGMDALKANITGNYNIAVGGSALYTAESGDYNVVMGYQAGYGKTTGARNILIGPASIAASYSQVTTGSNNIAIGNDVAVPNATASNQLTIGNLIYGTGLDGTGTTVSTGKIGIGTTTPVGKLTVVAPDFSVAPALSLRQGVLSTYGFDFRIDDTLGVLRLDTVNNAAFSTAPAIAVNRNSGNVGIATTSPWRTLSVTGSVGFDGLTGTTGAGSLCLSANKEVVYNSGSDNCLSSLRSTKHDINPLVIDAVSQIAALQPVSFVYNNDASSTVRYGFIAEDAAAVDAHLSTYDASGALSGVDDRSLLAIVVKAIQQMAQTIASFADSFTTKELTFTRASGDEITVQKLCIGLTCVTEDQLQTLLNSAGTSAEPSLPPSDEERPENSQEDGAADPLPVVSDAPSIEPSDVPVSDPADSAQVNSEEAPR